MRKYAERLVHLATGRRLRWSGQSCDNVSAVVAGVPKPNKNDPTPITIASTRKAPSRAGPGAIFLSNQVTELWNTWIVEYRKDSVGHKNRDRHMLQQCLRHAAEHDFAQP